MRRSHVPAGLILVITFLNKTSHSLDIPVSEFLIVVFSIKQNFKNYSYYNNIRYKYIYNIIKEYIINTYKLLISGNVQGVWYRSWFSKEAGKLNIKGYIENLNNPNHVEAIIQGNLDSLNQLIILAKIGPPLALVKKINKEKITLKKNFTKFSIK